MNAQPSIIAHILQDPSMTMTLKPEIGDAWFLDWVLRSPNHVSTHLTAGWYAYSSLLDIYTRVDIFNATEYFGGMGAQALMIENIFKPVDHVVMDYSAQAATHMRRELPDHVEVRQGDSYARDSHVQADLVGLDFGDLTAWKTRDEEKHRDLLDRVFRMDPKAVVVTDVAARYLHLHRERYESLLGPGTCGSYDSYLDALTARLEALYGYGLVAGYKDRWSTVFALAPVDVLEDREPGFFHPTPKHPIGLELL